MSPVATLARPERAAAPARPATTLDAERMTVLHLAVALYASDMPDMLSKADIRKTSPAVLTGWAERGLSILGPARLDIAARKLGALMDNTAISYVYDEYVPGLSGVRPSTTRRGTAMRAAWHLLAHLDTRPGQFYDLSQVRDA